MTMNNLPRLGLSLLLSASLGACSQQSPYHRPDLDVAPQWQQDARELAGPQAGLWWQGFQDPALDRLVEAVLAANPDMRVAGLRLKSALLGAELADTSLTPSVSANLGASGTKNMRDGSASSNLGPSLNLSYEVDLWGRLAAARDQAQWEAAASEQDLAATRLLLIGKTLEQYWQLAYLGSAITLGNQQLANLTRVERLTRAKYEAGAVTRLDLVQASQQKAGKQAEIATLILQRQQAGNALRLLLGQSHGPLDDAPTALALGPIPTLAAGIPADVLARRPDVRAAELRLRKTLARGDEIRTGFYPTLSLTGGASTTSDTLTQVLQNPIGTLGATLALPFLEYNKTRLSIAGADIDYQIAETEFRKQLYAALMEVEDGLAARQQGEQRLRYLGQQLDYAREAERLAGARFLAGATGVQPWLDEQNRLWDAELALLAQQQSQLNTMAGIYRALGGSDRE
ncbi:efflux transporter outer membrane subunit [Aeromonas taiwanensis]|uniref:efflux transporter outer membrane subunit n=1 Tax=Aeromonas taiwanensis TaxID=633417 RepID=UPI00207CBE4C|nr:efflux transporter outer membrane subunit [Aeromonas taiwanensis]MCO4202700.1 efflux transporter outer membrane subunit [Aeromonas taiwanensis]